VLNDQPPSSRSGSSGSGSSSSRDNSSSGQHGVRLICRAAHLCGPPSAGGFGVLPWPQHVHARRCKWAGRLCDPAAGSTPWVGLARSMLRGWPLPGDGWQAAVAGLPPPLRRLVLAVAQLPAPGALAAGGVSPASAACAAAGAPVGYLARDDDLSAQLGRAGVFTVGQLCSHVHFLDHPEQCTLFSRLRVSRTWSSTCARAVAALPKGWRALAAEEPAQASTPCDWLAATQRLATWPTASGDCIRLWQLSVRAATRMQLVSVEAARQDKWDAFAALVGDGATRNDVAAMFKLAWRMPVANMAKEIAWVLAHDAVMTPERVTHGMACSCLCGAQRPGRRHYFWDCPVARAVVSELQGRLPVDAGCLRRRHLWLLQAPPSQATEPWGVVALAALSALEHVRRVAIRRRLRVREGPFTFEGASRRAIAYFWAAISKFCALAIAPPAWREEPSSFFSWGVGPDGTACWMPALSHASHGS